jgi:hypothetical protein
MKDLVCRYLGQVDLQGLKEINYEYNEFGY